MNEKYDFAKVEKEVSIKISNTSVDGERLYVLGMFPYPSGQLHMGHLRNYTITDVLARYKRSRGYNVLHPIGWDAFGLPAENAAKGMHPAIWTRRNIKSMTEELKAIGISYDWERELATCDPDYYVNEQRFFLKLFEDGIAYKKLSIVNWDPVDQTVLANEQVIDGRGWRSGALVEKRELAQWFLRISDYAEDLLTTLDDMSQWPDSVKNMQREWIGRSDGCTIDFFTEDGDKITIFTTRPETIFGAACCAISTGHPLARQIAAANPLIADFIKHHEYTKYGSPDAILTDIKLIHPFNPDELLPVCIANFVLQDYGTGAVFCCPGHDTRDYEIAQKLNLPIKIVIDSNSSKDGMNGKMINSDFLNDLTVSEARQLIINTIIRNKIGDSRTTYKLKDWGVSRQRYWGCPIPIINCESCGQMPAETPVILPDDVNFSLGGNPLDHHPTWKHVECPKCKRSALRETDTFDTFMESSWYFIGFCSKDHRMDGANDWLPVDYYVGGIEHAILHLLYARYYMRLLHKYEYVNVREPFKRLITQGMVCHKTYSINDGIWLTPEEAHGRSDVKIGPSIKMSKSKKNIVTPSSVIKTHGADAARLFILSDSPIDKQLEWSERGLDGALRFLRKLWDFAISVALDRSSNDDLCLDEQNTAINTFCDTMLASITLAMENMQYNICIARARELFNFLCEVDSSKRRSQEIQISTEKLLRVLEPFIPYITQALWERLGHKSILASTPWPIYKEVQRENVNISIQVGGSHRSVVTLPADSSEEVVRAAAILDNKVQAKIAEREIKRVIFVKNRMINFVV